MNVGERFRAVPDETVGQPRVRSSTASRFGLSRLAARICLVVIVGLVSLYVATLRSADLEAGLKDAALQSLIVESDLLARSISAGSADGGSMVRLARSLTAERAVTASVGTASGPGLGAPGDAALPATIIDRDEVERLFVDVLQGSRTRARLYGVDGSRLADSTTALRSASEVATAPLPPLVEPAPSLVERVGTAVGRLIHGPPPSPPQPLTTLDGGEVPAEVAAALGGVKTVNEGADAVAVAVPVTNADGAVVAALALESALDPILRTARQQELAILETFAIAALVGVVGSIILAASILRPIRRLARAAERIKRGGASGPMPEFASPGEVGELSRVLHDMTRALYDRIDAIEAFAGEVAHELKNPLTSLRSAVETLPLARTDRSRERLFEVIQHDVQRINRLISDISDASKLDAELSRHRYGRFDLVRLLRTVTNAQDELAREREQRVSLVIRGSREPGAFTVMGNDSRLGQVFTNLVDNARSFTPDGGTVTVTAERFASFIEVVVDDEGPGIDEDVLERIFERFYTDRSGQASFGNNSGLGLAISRQIIEAHNGEIFAENRYRTTLTPEREVAGARLTVRLPTLQ